MRVNDKDNFKKDQLYRWRLLKRHTIEISRLTYNNNKTQLVILLMCYYWSCTTFFLTSISFKVITIGGICNTIVVVKSILICFLNTLIFMSSLISVHYDWPQRKIFRNYVVLLLIIFTNIADLIHLFFFMN
jgi:hypothetical protein